MTKSKILVPPHRLDETFPPLKIFLGGSIDMGAAIDWQAEVIRRLTDAPVTILNPRRPDWDSSWEQDINHPGFRGQVEWELDHLDIADLIFFHFDPAGKAPITLMELGLKALKGNSIVSCPRGYWRRGNVEIVCRRLGVPFFDDFEAAFVHLQTRIKDILDGNNSG